jgi:predicted glycosyltransferase
LARLSELRIWIDLANSPQVLFFHPIVQEIERRGHTTVITTRDFAQTEALATNCGMRHTPVGGHGGKRLSRIGLTLADRAWRLARFARANRCDLAVSHNSYGQSLAAAALRIPSVTLMDYEHQPANHLAFRLARRVIVPEFFPEAALRRFGATPKKTRRYRGVKEQIYLADFVPRPGFLQTLGIAPDRVVVVMRPPGAWGLYHDFENELFDPVFKYVVGHADATVVFLPRVASQSDAARARRLPNVIVPADALDGPNLLYHADLVISGGGTMNREAAVLGTPAYSVFKGKSAAVDRYLVEQGRMTMIGEPSDIPRIEIRKKQPGAAMSGAALVRDVTDAILEPLN